MTPHVTAPTPQRETGIEYPCDLVVLHREHAPTSLRTLSTYDAFLQGMAWKIVMPSAYSPSLKSNAHDKP